MLDKVYKHNFENIYASTKKELLKKVLEFYGFRDVEYAVFYIWANRLKNELTFEEKLSLYIKSKLIEREVYMNKKDKFKTRTKDI